MPPGSLHWSSWSDSRRTTLPRVAVALVVLALVAPMTVAATSASVSATPAEGATTGVTDPASGPEAAFDAEAYEEHRGDVVEFGVTLDRVDSAILRLRGPEYNATVGLHDEDGDGTVVVSFNTYLTGEDGRAFGATGSDQVTVRNESRIDGTTPVGSYDLAVDAADDGDPDDTATLDLQERSTAELRVGSALASERENLTDPDGVRRAMQSRGLDRADQLTMEDFLVLEIRASGLSGALAAQDGPNATARFFGLLDQPGRAFNDFEVGIALGALENDSSVGTSENAVFIDFASHESTSVVADPANDTYYVVVDFDAAPRDEGNHGDLQHGDAFDVRFVVGNDSHLANGSREVAEDRFDVVPRRAQISGAEPLYLDPEPNRTIRGETNVPAGYPVTVTVYAVDDVDFQASREVTVGPDGRFEVDLDLSEVPEGTTVGVRIGFQDQVILADLDLIRVERIPADLDVLEVRNEESIAVEVNASLGLGGFVVLHGNSVDGHVLGRSEYLPPGTHNVTVLGARSPWDDDGLVVVLYRDVDDDQRFDDHPRYGDVPYLENGVPVNETVEVPPKSTPSPTPPPTTPTTAQTETPTPAETWTPSPPSLPWETRTQTPTGPTVPGFGILPALVALLAAALFAAGRRNRER